MLDDLKLIHERDSHDALGIVERVWREHLDVTPWVATVRTPQNQAKQLALEVLGRSVVIYAGPVLSETAAYWQQAFQRQSKQLAWVSLYPECTESELLAWTKQPTYKPYAVIDLRSSLDDQQIQKQFEVTERLLSGRRPSPLVVQAAGTNAEEQVQWLKALADFVAVYTAILNNVDATDISLLQRFKQLMEE